MKLTTATKKIEILLHGKLYVDTFTSLIKPPKVSSKHNYAKGHQCKHISLKTKTNFPHCPIIIIVLKIKNKMYQNYTKQYQSVFI